MQIVIDIPEGLKDVFENRNVTALDVEEMRMAIRNGTPLDLEGLKSDMKALRCGYPYGLDYLLDCLNNRLGITIIEADKEGEE